MKLMFIVYHDYHTEARTQEILECSRRIGKTFFVSFSRPNDLHNCIPLVTGKGKRNYFTFIFDAFKYIKEYKPDILILHDNYTSIILGTMLLSKNKPYIIYDSSELYIDLKPKNIKQYLAKVMQILENKLLKHANIVIAANEERAQIMKKFFKLKEKPLIFDNIHRIDDPYNEEECDLKYHNFIKNDCFNTVYAGGISRARMTYELADAVGRLGEEYSLIIIGSSREEEKVLFNKFLDENNYKNVNYLGFVSRSDFRYLLNKCDVSISAFTQNTMNNKFCASGKVYESLFEGTPILVTENPPLKNLCETHGVGVSTNNFINGLRELKSNYSIYKDNTIKYVNNSDYNIRIEKFTEILKNKLLSEKIIN